MYVKLFASLYDGTLRGDAHGLLVFTNLLAHADRDGVVDKHPRAIADEVGLSVEEVRAALDKLEAPDPESRSPDEEGRRIKRLDQHRAWGWRIVNYVKYRDIRSAEDRRAQNRDAQRRYRERVASARVSMRKHASAASAHTDTDTDTYTDTEAVIGRLFEGEGLPRGGDAPSACADVADPQREDMRRSEAETAASTARTASPDAASVSRARSAASRGTRLPEDWRPDAALAAWTRDAVRGVDIDLPRELERFRDHWRSAAGARGIKRDWSATWRNWVRRAVDDARRAQARASPRLSAIAQVRQHNMRREAELSEQRTIIDISTGDKNAGLIEHDPIAAAFGFAPR